MLENRRCQKRGTGHLCWLLGTSVRKKDGGAHNFCMFLGVVAFTDERILEHFSCLYSSRRYCSSSLSVEIDRKEVAFKHIKNIVALETHTLQVFIE
jgi:hypothetical protein